MIPLKLQLRNFMCYREVEALDFRGFRLAFLTGDNGHGKSALLDAMTWALWGKTRLGARRDDELIHLGQTEMEVEFTFALDGNRYRVIRKRDSRGSGQSALELQVWDDQSFRPLTAPTIRETETRINELLRMDYETFINSAFLLQGRADEFTIKSPAERKRILGDILGFSIYDEYEERAKEQAKAKEQEAGEIAAQIREMDRELERRPEYERELAQAETQAADLTQTLQKAEGELRQLREEKKELDLKAAQIDDLSARLAQGEQELAELQEQIAASEARLADYEAVLAERQAIEKGFAALSRARQLNETLSLKLSQLVKLNERKGQLEAAIAEARHELTTQQRLLAEKIAELETKAEKTAEWGAELAAVRTKLEGLARLESDRQAKQRAMQELSNQVASLQTRNEQLRAEIEPLKEKVDLLSEAEARCPLCDNELSEADRDRLIAQFTAEGTEKADFHRANQTEIKALLSQSETLQQEIEAIDQELKEKPALQKQEATLEKALDGARAAVQGLAEASAGATAVEEKLATRDYAPAEQSELAGLTAQLHELGYDANAHEEVRQDLQILARFEEAQARLQTALDQIEGERANLKKLRHSQDRKQTALAADIERRSALQQAVARLPEVRQQVEEKEREVDRLQGEERRARDVVAAIKQQIAHCQYLVKEREKRVAERQKAAEEKAIYDELRVAFGKKGLQAMIIESAIPEIEDEANALLARMTDGRMNVRFETQRETKKGDAVETLDIKISDELGTRSYELYSVDGAERTYIRRNGFIHSLPIEDLWDASRETESFNGYQMQPTDYEALCYVNGTVVWQPVSAILRHPAPDKMLKVSCVPGNYSITITPNHSIFAMTSQGLVVKRGDELQPGDFVLTPRRIPKHRLQEEVDLVDYIEENFIQRRAEVGKSLQWDNELIWSRRDQTQKRFVENREEWAEFLGIAVAEASGRKALTIAIGNKESMAERVIEMASSLFGIKRTSLMEVPADTMARYVAKAPGISSDTPQRQYRPFIGGRLLTHIIGNIIGQGAQRKRVPQCIFNASPEAQKAFLRGLIAGDGHLRIRPDQSQAEIGITTISLGLVADVVFLCRQLGIWARVEKHSEAGFQRGMMLQESYRVAISGQDNVSQLFSGLDIVSYTSSTKYEGFPLALLGIQRNTGRKRLRRGALDERFPCGSRVVPLRSREQYRRISDLIRDWNVLEISKVEEVQPTSEYVYDLVVPDNHSFVAGTGAILVHNSGGEAFRINFAIRIALSKLLARRAGARLQTLVIDEGFGTQDTQGQARLVEAINSIQEDFEKIIVITHIKELENLFLGPVIKVFKPFQGSSQITVIS